MKNTIYKGAGVAIVTPMDENSEVNYNVLRDLIDFQIDNGTDAIIACGTTGEASTLTDEEHIEVIRVAIEHTKKRVPVIAGTGSNDTKYALELSIEAKEAGADGLLVVSPYYNKTSQQGLINHYNMIANNCDCPIIVYNVPSRTGMNIKPQTYAELSKHKNIVGIKEANGNISEIAQTMALCGDNIDLYSGNDDQITALLSLGGAGVISVLSNVAPQLTHDMCVSFFNGNVEKSRQLQLDNLELCNALFCDVNPIPVKEALNMMGWKTGQCRMPLAPLSAENRGLLENTFKKYGLI